MPNPAAALIHSTDYGSVLLNPCGRLQVVLDRLFWTIPMQGFETFCDYLLHLLTETGARSNCLPGRDLYVVAMENDCLTVSLSRDEIGQLVDLLDGAAIELQRKRLESLYQESAA